MAPACRRHRAAMQAVNIDKLGIHASSRLQSVLYSTLRDIMNATAGIQKKRGRPPCQSNAEEHLIEQAVLYFAGRGFPLRTKDILDIMQLFVSLLPLERRCKIPFKNDIHFHDYMAAFIKRHPELRMRRRAELEMRRKIAMSPITIAKHYAIMTWIYKTYDITSPPQIFKIDESCLSSRTGGIGKGKAAIRSNGHSNAVELELSSNIEHITIMPVVSADGKPRNRAVILPGTLQKFRVCADGKRETLIYFLSPPPNT